MSCFATSFFWDSMKKKSVMGPSWIANPYWTYDKAYSKKINQCLTTALDKHEESTSYSFPRYFALFYLEFGSIRHVLRHALGSKNIWKI